MPKSDEETVTELGVCVSSWEERNAESLHTWREVCQLWARLQAFSCSQRLWTGALAAHQLRVCPVNSPLRVCRR